MYEIENYITLYLFESPFNWPEDCVITRTYERIFAFALIEYLKLHSERSLIDNVYCFKNLIDSWLEIAKTFNSRNMFLVGLETCDDILAFLEKGGYR